MAQFDISYEKTMNHEGQYSNDPRDLGGETWKGISRKNWPKWNGWMIIDQIKRTVNTVDLVKVLRNDEELENAVREFYYTEFWAKLLGESISDQDIADELFDTAINQGLAKASVYFQQALNLLNNNQKLYSDIEVDGKLGNDTLKSFVAYMHTSNLPGRSVQRNVSTILKVMNGLQFERYKEICESNTEQEVFFYGWINRV